MWWIVGYSLILVSFKLIGGNMLHYIQEDFCELYLNASEINDRTCLIKNDVIFTNEYELELVDYNLNLKWSHENFIDSNIPAVTTELRNISSLKISGIQSSEDPRLRPASFYLNKLNLEYVKYFHIIAEHFAIEQHDIHYEEGPTELRIEFKETITLGRINDYVAESSKRIRVLGISGLQLRSSDLCNHFQFLSLPELQNNIEQLSLDVDTTLRMKCFGSFRRLKFIFFNGPYEPFENLTAFICPFGKSCIFTMGTNDLRCPSDCECSHKSNFQVSCFNRNLAQIPPVPIPISGDIELVFDGNLLSQLPNNTLPGYIDIKELDVSENKITSISIHQLPRKLRTIDISNNLIKTVDSRVSDYLFRIDSVHLEGMKWILNCDEKHLMKLVYKFSTYFIFLEQLNAACPPKCKCCFNRPTENFLIKCTRRETYPELPDKIPNKVSLILANCSIRELPENLSSLLITQNITNLDLRNNSLKSLDAEVVNFYNNHNETTIKLSRNPWTCYCKDKSFLLFLKSRDPLEYTIAIDRCHLSECPEGCFCCLESSESSAVTVDCRGQQLTQFPHLPDSVTTLDLRDNSIKEINADSQAFISDKILFKRLKVFLSGNPWICTCDFFAFAKNISFAFLSDFAEMDCSNLGQRLAMIEESEICPFYFKNAILFIIFSLILALIAFVYFTQSRKCGYD